MKKVMVAMGTRPEAIKLCPLVLELKKRTELETVVLSTGQHRAMLDQAMEAFSVKPDIDLDIMRTGQSLSVAAARILARSDEILTAEKPDLVVVQGDTITALMVGMAAFYKKIPVGHVEAGLRTYHIHSPFPEELHRQAISLFANYHFAPTVSAKNNLLREGKEEKHVFLTGNTVVDAMQYTLARRDCAKWVFPKEKRLLVFTAHRRENLGEPIRGMFRALRRIVEAHEDVLAICPLHHNPEVRRAAKEVLQGCKRIRIIEPPEIISFHQLLAKSYLVLTDSGGIQEETTALGIPTLVMRYSTERREGIEAGCLKLAGSGEEGIVTAATRLLVRDSEDYLRMRSPSKVFGDGMASVRIANILSGVLR
jgi:UDP-N-acetylglucosamine 2-epimerase (non-hydrolysing)